jgi:O-antigen ligase
MQLTPKQETTIRNAGLVMCIVLPWLNPFTSSPSTAVLPLLFSWMMSACALLALVELPLANANWTYPERWAVSSLFMAWLASLLYVPQVVDHGLTLGLLAAGLCVAVMAAVGRRAAVQSNQLLGALLLAWVLAAAISSVLGLLQYLGLAHELSPWVNQPFKGDAFANLRQRNQFASLTSLGLVALLGWVAWRTQARELTPSQSRTTWALLALLSAGLACSVSRTGAVQWVLVGGLAAWWAWRHQAALAQRTLMWLALAAPLWVMLWSMLLPWAALQLTGDMGASMILRVAGQAQDYGMCGSRSVLWANVLQMLAQHPWLGWGWGETDYAHFMTAYNGMRFCDILDNAHNLPLHLALEFGVPFAICVCLLIGVWAWRRQPWREADATRLTAWGILLVLGIHSLLEYPLWYGPFQMSLGLAVGLLWANPAAKPKTQNQVLPMLLASALFIGCLYAAWDFHRVGQVYRQPAARDVAYRNDPIGHAKRSWLFHNQAEFADLTTSQVTPDNAPTIYQQAMQLMHYSPEPSVVQRLIDSAKQLGLVDVAQMLEARLADVQENGKR